LRRGEFQEALASYQRARQLLHPADPRLKPWEVAVKDAERLRLLATQLDAIVEGRKRPANADEGEEFAQLCLSATRRASPARLYKDAFTADPKLAEQKRLEAAQAAVRAGAGKDAARLTEAERAGWRTQARDWLRAGLSALTRQADSANAEAR